MLDPQCSERCESKVACVVCGHRKAPIGRSVPLDGPIWCDGECPGYRKDPYPPHLWPGEYRELRAVASPKEKETER